jgi:hypothetical protein
LNRVQLRVRAALRHQLLLRAHLDDLAPSITTIRSAIRTVENRCDTEIVTRPLAAAVFDAAAKRSNNACPVCASSAAVGSSKISKSGASRIRPLASARDRHFYDGDPQIPGAY